MINDKRQSLSPLIAEAPVATRAVRISSSSTRSSMKKLCKKKFIGILISHLWFRMLSMVIIPQCLPMVKLEQERPSQWRALMVVNKALHHVRCKSSSLTFRRRLRTKERSLLFIAHSIKSTMREFMIYST